MTRLIRAELAKLRTSRTTPMLLAAMVGFAIITVIFVVTVSGTQGNRRWGRQPAPPRRRPLQGDLRGWPCWWASWP